MIGVLITILIYVLVLGVIYWVVEFAINNIPIPDPFARIARVVLVVIFALILISLLLSLVGVSTGVNLPRLN